MTEQTTNRRAEDKNVQVLATKIEGLAQDMNEMKHGIAKMADALTKLAIVEERSLFEVGLDKASIPEAEWAGAAKALADKVYLAALIDMRARACHEAVMPFRCNLKFFANLRRPRENSYTIAFIDSTTPCKAARHKGW